MISALPEFDDASVRERLDAELRFYELISKVANLNSRDISRAGGIFMQLYSVRTPEKAAELSILLLSAITMLRLQNDGDTVFSIKSKGTSGRVNPPLSPISERSGVEYEPLPQAD